MSIGGTGPLGAGPECNFKNTGLAIKMYLYLPSRLSREHSLASLGGRGLR